jgi:hypothetical protein
MRFIKHDKHRPSDRKMDCHHGGDSIGTLYVEFSLWQLHNALYALYMENICISMCSNLYCKFSKIKIKIFCFYIEKIK